MKNHNSQASRLRLEPTAAFGEGAGLSNILLRPNRKPVFFLSGAGKCFSTRVWNTPLQTWGRKTCKKKSLKSWGWDNMANILHAIFSKALSWQKFNIFLIEISLKFVLIISHQWLRQWLGAELVTTRYLNQWWTLTRWWMASAPGNILYDEFESYPFNSSPPGQNGRHLADDIFKCTFVNEKFCTLIKISLKFVPKGPIDKSLSEPMLTWFTDAYMRH